MHRAMLSGETAQMWWLVWAFAAFIHDEYKICMNSHIYYLMPLFGYLGFVCLIWFFTSHHQSFSFKGMGLSGLNQYYLARIIVSCSRTQHSGTGEAQTRGPLVSSQALYHWAGAFHISSCVKQWIVSYRNCIIYVHGFLRIGSKEL